MISQACPLFVHLVENGYTDFRNPVTRLVAEEYLEPVRKEGVDTLILGCTHYPVIREVIADLMGPEVQLISSGAEAASTHGAAWRHGICSLTGKNRGRTPIMSATAPRCSSRTQDTSSIRTWWERCSGAACDGKGSKSHGISHYYPQKYPAGSGERSGRNGTGHPRNMSAKRRRAGTFP